MDLQRKKHISDCGHKTCEGEFCRRPQKGKTIYIIPRQSAKRIKEQRAYVRIVKRKVEADPFCEVRENGCQIYATGQQHVQKRSPANLLKEENMINCCNSCQSWIEEHHLESIELGFTISKFVK